MNYKEWEDKPAYQFGFQDGYEWDRLRRHFSSVATIENLEEEEYQEEYQLLFCSSLSELSHQFPQVKKILNRYL